MMTSVSDEFSSGTNVDQQAKVFDIAFSPETAEDLLALFLAVPEKGQGLRFVVTANVDHIVQLRQNSGLRSAYAHAWRRTIDGAPVYLYSRMKGLHVPKVTGADLFARIMERLDPALTRPFFVCADEAIAEGLRKKLQVCGFEKKQVGTLVPPYGFERDELYGDEMAQAIRDHGTTHLFFGVGCPKSEIWMDTHRYDLGDVYGCAVGAALAFQVGVLKRAPELIQKVGMEWFWRALQEPDRLLKRYFVHSWAFLAIMRDDWRRPLKPKSAKTGD